MKRRRIPAVVLAVVVASCSGGEAGPAEMIDAAGDIFGAYTDEGFESIAPEFAAGLEATLLTDESLGADVASRKTTLLTDGGVLHTTLDPGVQAALRSAFERLGLGGDGPDGAVVVLDRPSGAVLAMGASDPTEAAVEVILDSGRPAGSALKPFALAAALSRDYTLQSTVPAPECVTLADEPARRTCGGTGRTETLLEATVASLNPVFVQLVAEMGVSAFADLAAEVGISSAGDMVMVGAVLGDVPVSVLDMANAYRVIANQGAFSDVVYLTDEEPTLREVLSADVWSAVDEALRQVVARGTAAQAGLPPGAAGKTGTADGLTDAWFVGYDDAVVIAVWVGFLDAPDRPLVPPATATPVSGGTLPAQLWTSVAAALDE